MAEMIVSSAVGNLARLMVRVGDINGGELKSEIERLRNELHLLNSLIEESDKSIEDEDSVRVYSAQLREVANLIEDVLDEYDLLSVNHGSYLRRVGVLFGKLKSRDKLTRNIDNIKSLLVDIRDKGERYGMRERVSVANSAALSADHRRFFSAPDEELLGDANRDADELTRLLVEGDSRRSAVAVLGGGGVGKTALAQRIYNANAVAEWFYLRAWIVVPRGRVGEEEIVRLIVRQVRRGRDDEGRVEAMSREELYVAVRESMMGKRYLLVFDDVWKEALGHVVRDVLPDDGTGSRVMITTRRVAIAASFITTRNDRIHKVGPLSEEASRELFCKIVFGGDRCPDELVELSAEILGMCEGLPLAIKAVAGLLSTKQKVPREWRRLRENFSLENEPGLVALSKIIALGFDDLPPHLRRCFMYFSIFPKESLIRNEKIVKLWIAEGFVQEKRGDTLEEVAEEYLKELVDRNLVEVCEGFYGIEKFFRVHNLMHEVMQKKANDRDFCVVTDGNKSSSRGKGRRVVISSTEGMRKVLNHGEGSQVRSVFLWNTGPLNDYYVLVKLFKKYYLLTMLDIENSPLEILPEEVGNLSCLNYLSLKNTKVKKLPKTVKNLSKLEVLDLSDNLLVALPMEIAILNNLRHLLASRGNEGNSFDSAKGVKIKVGIGALVNLQTLETVDANLSGMDVIQELKNLNQLRSLRVSRLTTELTQALCVCINEMAHLEYLHLQSLKNNTLDLQTISSPPTQLERLILKGELLSLPHWIPRLDNLRMMCLSLSSLTDDPLNSLRYLPNLESLWLYSTYRGPSLSFEDGFKKLKLLVLREMIGLEVIEIAEDAMPLLEELRIGPSPLMAEVPAGVVNLRCLKVVSFYDMPDEFVQRVQPNDGPEFPKVEHVPSVLFWYGHAARRRGYVSYRLGEPELLRRLNNGGDSDSDTGGVSRQDSRLSFSYSEDEGDTASVASSFSGDSRRSFSYSEVEGVTSAASSFRWDNIRQSSLTSDRLSFFSDDIED